MLKKYIGCKLIEAEPAYRVNGEILPPIEFEADADAEVIEGYKVVYPDGYVSFSPKEVFEKAYMQVNDDVSVTEEFIEKFIVDKEVMLTGDGNFIVVKATLVTGEVMVEVAPNRSPFEYQLPLGITAPNGEDMCMAKIVSRIKAGLEFMTKAAVNGVNHKKE